MESMKDKIIELATELFMKQGYLATSTRQIAKELNITQPAIYYHFENKEQIYIQVLKKFANEIGSQLYQLLDSGLSEEIILLKMSEFLIERHPMNFSLMMTDMENELPEDIRKQVFILWHENYFAPFETFFSSLSGQLNDEIPPKNISLHFLRALSAYVDENINSHNDLPIAEFIHIFFFGIVKRD